MDIDIDIKKDTPLFQIFKTLIPASQVIKDELVKHNSGAYFQNIAKDPMTGLAALPYDMAEEIGYFKMDFLHINALDDFHSNEELRTLAATEPNWTHLHKAPLVKKLFQISNQFEIVNKVRPTSLLEVSDLVALIRPNKQWLVDKYLKDKVNARKELYTRRTPADMRKSHCVPYAQIIIAQMNLIDLGRL